MKFLIGMVVAIAALQAPARDTPAQQPTTAPATAKISGRVVAADSGRPVRRARVILTGPQVPQRNVLTDDSGAFEIANLPGGRYTLSAARTGFVTLSYGQRRPRQAGTPLQVEAGQELKGVDFRLPRGGVITGTVYDDMGEPLPGTMVRLMTYQYSQGTRQLSASGGAAQTDDRGEYRIWGLNPGDYFVTAVAPNADLGGRGIAPLLGRGGRGAAVPDNPGQRGYAPTYYPGAATVDEARPVTVGLGAEVSGVNFNVLLVRTSRVSGRVTTAAGVPTANGNVQLTFDGGTTATRGNPYSTYGSRIQSDGQFSIANVPPGRYTLRARGEEARVAQSAMMSVIVSGDDDVSDVLVVLSPASSISGTITLESLNGAPPAYSQFRVTAQTAPQLGPFPFGPNNERGSDAEGRFTINGLPAGDHLIRSAQTPRGWTMKSVLLEGRDFTDTPIELMNGQKLAGVTVVFTDRLTEINGTLTDQRGMPITDFTVLAFPQDDSLWTAQSRHIMTARPDQNGKFQLRSLPPGPYYMTAIDPAEQGEWFDPGFLDDQRPNAIRVTLVEGETKTQDLRISP